MRPREVKDFAADQSCGTSAPPIRVIGPHRHCYLLVGKDAVCIIRQALAGEQKIELPDPKAKLCHLHRTFYTRVILIQSLMRLQSSSQVDIQSHQELVEAWVVTSKLIHTAVGKPQFPMGCYSKGFNFLPHGPGIVAVWISSIWQLSSPRASGSKKSIHPRQKPHLFIT